MGKMISGIIIEKSSFPKNTQIEECEKKEGNYILRFQRPAATSLRENCVRFFSDLINGITKAQDTLLCNLEGNLPPVINIKGQSVIINKQSKDSAEGKLTSYDKNLPVGAENIAIFMRNAKKHPEASQNANQTSDADAPPANVARAAPPPPSIVGRPQLSTTRQAPLVNQAPQPPRMTSAELTAHEQNHDPINLRPPPSPPPEDDPSPLPQNYQLPAKSAPSREPPAPPPPGGLTGFNNGNEVDITLQDQNAAEKSTAPQLNEQIKQGVKLKKTEISIKQGSQDGLNLSPQNALLNKVMSMRKDIEGNDKKANDEEWE